MITLIYYKHSISKNGNLSRKALINAMLLLLPHLSTAAAKRPRNLTPLEENGHTNNALLVKIQKNMGILSTPSEHVKKVHALINYKWSYNPHKWPYKWITGVITLPIKLGAVVEAVEDLASNLKVHKVASVCSKGAASEMGRQAGNYRVFFWVRWFQEPTIWIYLDPFRGAWTCHKNFVQDHSLRQKLKGNGFHHHHHPHKGENKKETTCSFQSRCSCHVSFSRSN